MNQESSKIKNNVIIPGRQVRQTFVYSSKGRHKGQYLIFVPQNYTPTQPFPTIFFLHGSGERGENIQALKRHGLPKIVEQQPDFPFTVISPQCPARRRWPLALLEGLFQTVNERIALDPERLYLTGLSLGGYGVWKWAQAQPQRFAALAPICGWSNPEYASRIAHLPIWVFHGLRDEVVPVAATLAMVTALEKAGGRPRVTIYRHATHDAWTQAYANRRLYTWFLSHRRSGINNT